MTEPTRDRLAGRSRSGPTNNRNLLYLNHLEIVVGQWVHDLGLHFAC